MLFSGENKSVALSNQFSWFNQWTLHRSTLEQLSARSGYSKRKLQYLFDQYLSNPPQWIIHQKINLYLIIDGTYFRQGLCLILYYDSVLKYALFYRFTTGELYKELKEDLENLKKLGIEIAAVTCDGKRSIIKSVKKVYPQATLQRCMVHVQRNVRKWLTRNPTTEAAQKLRYLIGLLHHIHNMVEQHMSTIAFEKWYEQYQSSIEARTYHPTTGRWWYTHKGLRRAAVSVKNSLANLFHFIGDPHIPKTTNGLDAYFGHLKEMLNVHRGLSKEHKKGFILWYLYLKSISK